MKNSLFLILLLIPSVLTYAHKGKTVRVRGEYSVLTTSALSVREATHLARQEAKRKAIEMVCGTTVKAWDILEISNDNETFNSAMLLETYGEVTDFKIINEGFSQSDDRSVETLFFCEADVTVRKTTPPDRNFFLQINGLKGVYAEGDAISFSIKPSKNGYLKIFLFSDLSNGDLIFPNYAEQSIMLQQDSIYSFPINNTMEYRIEKNTGKQYETNRLVFLFTKDEQLFDTSTASREQIEKWISNIPTDRKYLYTFAFDIR